MIFRTVILLIILNERISGSYCNFQSVNDLVNEIVQNQSNISDVYEEYSNKSDSFEDEIRTNNLMSFDLIDSFPSDFMGKQIRSSGGVILHIMIFAYFCLLLSVVIDSFFIPSIHHFSHVFNISPNISGSTLMALGTSSPEFFTSIVGVFIAESSIGTGAIIGSSIFNMLAIPGCCGLAVYLVKDKAKLAKVNSWPIVRDIVFYTVTVIMFLISIKDNSVDSIESLIFIFIYCIYIFSLYIWSNFKMINDSTSDELARNSTIDLSQQFSSYGTVRLHSDDTEALKQTTEGNYLIDNTLIRYIIFPINFIIDFTIPKSNEKIFMITFILSNVWIALLTYCIVWMVSLIGDTFDFPEAISGMTILAVGTNLPELISSFIVIQKYYLPDMAICQTIGSNIFEILIGLGFPWFLKILALSVMDGSELHDLRNYVIPLEDDILNFVSISMILSILAFVVIFCLNDWILTINTSLYCFVAYTFFISAIFIFNVNNPND